MKRPNKKRWEYIKNNNGMAMCGDFLLTETECDVVIVLNVVFTIFFSE